MKSGLFLLCLLPALLSAGPEACFSRQEMTSILLPEQDSVALPGLEVERGSVSVSRGGVSLSPGADYEADYASRVVRFLYSRALPETLLISCLTRAVEVDTLHFRRALGRVPLEFDSAAPPAGETGAPGDSLAAPSGITVGGSKTVSVTMGSGSDFSIDQALNLNIHGDISEGVRINAILTDQNLPFQPEGNTESIRELDRVLVEVETERFKASLGDLMLEERHFRFGNYARKTKGALAEWREERREARAAGAVTEGLFRTLEIQGMEQNQGPYRLTDREGRSGVVVLAGTERVWVDGRLKKRGRDNDYTVEYGNGQVTFTQNCLITADDRITVEYEYTEQAFSRTALLGAGGVGLFKNRLRIRGGVFRERDDPSKPLAASLTRREREALAQTGDSAAAEGAGVSPLERDSVDLYRGFYAWEDESGLPDSHYVYHPPSDTALYRRLPLYRVEFLYAGPGGGPYAQDTVTLDDEPSRSGTYERLRVFYRYRGPGLGDYKQGRRLDLPAGHTVGSMRGDLKLGEALEWNGEVAGSVYDPNVLSPRDDHDNRGVAAANAVTLKIGQYLDESGPGRFTLTASHELVQERFRPLESSYNPYVFWNKWDLALPASGGGEVNLAEGHAAWEPLKGISLGGGGGLLSLGKGKSTRVTADAGYKGGRASEAALSHERVEAAVADTERVLARTQGGGRVHVGPVTPRAGFTGEDRTGIVADRPSGKNDMREVTVGARTDPLGPVTAESEGTWRRDRVSRAWDPGKMADSARAYTIVNRLYFEGPGSFSSDAAVTNRRSSRFELNTWNEYKSDLVAFNSFFQPLDGAVTHRFRYELNATRSQVLVEMYEEAGPGLGTHRRDSLTGDYVPYEGGDYRYAGARVDTNGRGSDVNASELSTRLTLKPGRLKGLRGSRGFMRDLTSESVLNASQEKLSDGPGGGGPSGYVPDLLPSRVNPEGTVKYRLDFKQEFLLEPAGGGFSLRLRIYPRNRSDFRRASDNGLDSDEWSSRHYSLYLRYAPAPRLTLEHEPSVEWILRKKAYSDMEFDILNRRLFNQATWSLNGVFSFPVALTLGRSDDRRPFTPLEVFYYSVRPGVVAALAERGKAELNYEFLDVRTTERFLYYEMAEGNPAGRTHRISMTLRATFGRNMESDFQYRGEKSEDPGRWIHRGSAQLKAYF